MQFNRRDWLAGSAALAGIAALPRTALAEEIGGVPIELIHPQLRAIAARLASMFAAAPPLTRANLTQLRKPNPLWQPEPLTAPAWEKRVIPGVAGQPEVTIYVVGAKPGTSRPAILHTHGGGYVTGSAWSAINGLQEICAKLDCVAVTVEYRLAPETTFTGSVEDNYVGLKWLHTNAASVGADPAKIALLGESAGGGHAALLAIAARDRGEVPVCFQCLIYPMLDDRTGTTRPVAKHVGTIGWKAAQNSFGWESFLGTKPGLRTAPKGGVPARVANLQGLPPAFIGVGTLDLFVDENIDYAQRLNAAGVATELIVVPGAFHGFDVVAKRAKLPLGDWFEGAKFAALKRGWGIA